MQTVLWVDIDNEFRILNQEAALLEQVLPNLQGGDSFEEKALRFIQIAGVAATVVNPSDQAIGGLSSKFRPSPLSRCKFF